jgi:hypothetical protein
MEIRRIAPTDAASFRFFGVDPSVQGRGVGLAFVLEVGPAIV